MAEVRLKAEMRSETGKGPARRSRAAGKVPGVVYGHGMEPLAIEVDRREYVTALHTDARSVRTRPARADRGSRRAA